MPEPGPGPDLQRFAKVLDRVIEASLPQTGPGIAFRQELKQTCIERAQPGLDVVGIGHLPALACAAVGGDPGAAAPVTTAWQLVRLSAKLLDDVEDLDVKTGTPVAINAATGLLFAAPLVLSELSSSLGPDVVWRASLELQRAMLRAAAGQHADLSGAQRESREEDADTWLEIARAKSGELLGWAAWAGALAGGADEQTRTCLREYGSRLGVLLQVADDFYGIWSPSGAHDLAGRHLCLPVCYARSVLKGRAREHLEGLLSAAARKERAAEAEAVELITNLGAQAYLLAVARVEHEQALAALEHAQSSLRENGPLVTLLNRVMPIVGSLGGLTDDQASQRFD